MIDPIHQKYLRRVGGYVLANKGLLVGLVIVDIAGRVVTFVYPWLIGLLIDQVIQPRTPRPVEQRFADLRWITTMGVIAAIVFAIAGYARGHLNMKLGNRIVLMLRRDLFDHLQRLSLQFYSKQRTGGLVWRLMHEVHGVNSLVHGGFLLVFLDLLQVVIAMWLLVAVSGRLTVAVLIVFPMYVLTFKYFNPQVRRASERVQQHFGRISGNIQEHFSAVAVVKCNAAEEREAQKFFADHEEHYGYIVKQSHVGHLVGAVSEVWIHLGTCIIIGYGGYLALAGNQTITAGDITRFLGYVGIMYGPVKRFADLNLVYQNSLAAIRRVFRVFDIQPRMTDKPDAIATPPATGLVRYENVRFHYGEDSDENRTRLDEDEPEESHYRIRAGSNGHGHGTDNGDGNGDGAHCPATKWVVDDVTLEVQPGQRAAFVGPSGCGKTTLVSLLPRLFDVIDGRITIDGIDVRDYSLKALRSAIAIVQQESFMFSGTVRDNILYGRPDASERDMIEAAKAANAHEFITQMPDAYNTILGERGVNLSGGQRQRLSIARAILRDPRILILDEATSALDTESEVLVQEALERLMQGRTCLIIAHRLSTVRTADRIFAMRHGKIIESGRHEDLLAANGVYARLARAQLAHPQFAEHRRPFDTDPDRSPSHHTSGHAEHSSTASHGPSDN